MNKTKFLSKIKETIAELEVFIYSQEESRDSCKEVSVNLLDSSEDAKAVGRGWCDWLEKTERLVEETQVLTSRQIDEIGGLLFRGMGSFADFWADEKKFGIDAKSLNERLEILRHGLYIAFKE